MPLIAHDLAGAGSGPARTRRFRSGASGALLLLAIGVLGGCRDEPTAPAPPAGTLAIRPPGRAQATATVTTLPRMAVDLGTPDGISGEAVGVNDSGVVVGYVSSSPAVRWPVRWLPDGRVERLPLSDVAGVANDGTVGGRVDGCRPAVWHPDQGVTTLVADPGDPAACAEVRRMTRRGILLATGRVASTGQARGYAFSQQSSGTWQRTVIDAPPGTGWFWLTDAQPARGVVGVLFSSSGGPPELAFYWAWAGELTTFPVQGCNACGTAAYAINADGVIVGDEMGTPMRFAGGPQYIDGALGGEAVAINDRGDILVSDYNYWESRIVRASGEVVPLAGLGRASGYGSAMNEAGTVVGRALTANGISRPALWDANAPPPPFEVSAGGPYAGSETQTVWFRGTVTVGGRSPFTYRWDYGDGATEASEIGTHAYADDGTYTVTFSVTDATGRVAAATTDARIANVSPVINMSGVGPTPLYSGEQLGGSARFYDVGPDAPWRLEMTAVLADPSGTGISVTGTGSVFQAPATVSAAVTLRRAGYYLVSLSVHDKDGGSAHAPIQYSADVLRLPLPMTAAAAGATLLTTTISAHPAAYPRDIALATVRLGDGTVAGIPIATGADGQPLAELRDVNGDNLHELVLSFRWDALEQSGALAHPERGLVLRADLTDERQVEARAPVPPRPIPPVVAIGGGPYGGIEGSPISFIATATGGALPHAYRWSFGDGAEATALDAAHAYADDGSYVATFTATGADGLAAGATTTVSVANAPPTLTLEPGATLYSGDAYTIRGHVNDPGVRDAPWRYAVEWPAGLAAASGEIGAVPGDFAESMVLRRAGRFTVPAVVTDKDGGQAQASATVTVLRLPVPIAAAPPTEKAAAQGNGLLTVVVEGTARVAVADIDVASVRVGGVPLATRGDGTPMAALEDADGDGVMELVLKVRRAALKSAVLVDSTLVLQADLRDGRQVEGRATLRALADGQ